MVDNRGPELLAVCSLFVAMAFVSVALRCYVRLRLVKAFGWDDGFMVLALLCNIMFATCAIGGIHFGTGRHQATLSEDNIMRAKRYWWFCYIGYCWAMIFVKVSIGMFLLRVTIRPIHRWIIYIAMGLTVLTGLVFFFVTLLQCNPMSFFWNTQQKGTCVPVDVIIALTFLYSVVSVICDFTFAILPVFLVWNLNMSLKTRSLLVPILGMACVASVAVLCRMTYVMDFKDPDFLWATLDIAIWSDVEQGLAITAGSLATLRPLYRQFAAHFGFDQTGNGGSDPKTPGKGSSAVKWLGAPTTDDHRRKKGMFSLNSRLRTEKGTTRKSEDEYGLGDLQPIRLRDDLIEEQSVDASEKGFNTWTIEAGRGTGGEEHPARAGPNAGAITLHKQIIQASSERRSMDRRS